MRSSTIVLAIGLLAAPLSMIASPLSTAAAADPFQTGNTVTTDSVNGHPLVDAPVPGVAEAGISPADRVAGPGGRTLDAGPADSTPFSSTPSGSLADGGTQANRADRVTSPANTNGVVPNLSR